MPSPPSVHSPNSPLPQLILTGFSNSTLYDTHRARYSPTAIEHMLTSMSLMGKKKAKILEIAAGTGIMTELLAGREEEFEIIAVEPHEEMRKVLESKGLKGVKVVEGEAVGCGDIVKEVLGEEGKMDGVVVAQAFHWFSTLSALQSIHSSLLPGATLSLTWNIEDYNQSPTYTCTTKWETKLRNLCLKHQDGLPRYRDTQWENVWKDKDNEEELKRTWELPYNEKVFNLKVCLAREGLWKRMFTLSYLKNLMGIEKEEFRKSFDEVLDTAEDIEVNQEGEITVHYITHLVWLRKKIDWN